jgi:hypothetical protein
MLKYSENQKVWQCATMNLLSTKFVDISKFGSTQSTWVIVVCTYDWNVSSSMYLSELVDARVMNGDLHYPITMSSGQITSEEYF